MTGSGNVGTVAWCMNYSSVSSVKAAAINLNVGVVAERFGGGNISTGAVRGSPFYPADSTEVCGHFQSHSALGYLAQMEFKSVPRVL